MWHNYIKMEGTTMWIGFIWLGNGPVVNSCGQGSEPKGFIDGRRLLYTCLKPARM